MSLKELEDKMSTHVFMGQGVDKEEKGDRSLSEQDKQFLQEKGIYKITNILNNKLYIGHTKKSFISRFTTHYDKLKGGYHKGYAHLQNSVNTYGIENFEFSIVEICESNFEKVEEKWIEYYDCTDKEKGYNVNKHPGQSPILTEESKEKMRNSLIDGYKSGRLKPNKSTFKKGITPWNKGKKYKSTDHLKVPKKNKGSRENFSKTMMEKLPSIQAFNTKKELIGEWRYMKEVEADSINPESFLVKSMILKNPKGRNGYIPTKLFPVNIQKSCRTGKSYKGIFFKYKTVAYNKSDKLLENP